MPAMCYIIWAWFRLQFDRTSKFVYFNYQSKWQYLVEGFIIAVTLIVVFFATMYSFKTDFSYDDQKQSL